MYQVRTLRGRLSYGAFSSVFLKIRGRRELAGNEGKERHGLHRMQVLRVYLFLQNSASYQDQGRQKCSKGDEVIC